MDFITMQRELSGRLRAYDETIADDATQLKRWLNMAQQDIAGAWDWDFLKAVDIVQTVADYTTGTVSINAGSTSGTFSGAPTVSMTNRFIQFSTDTDWYQITAHTSSTTSFTIDPAYKDTSNLSAGTYKIRKLYYGTDSTIDSVMDVKNSNDPYPLHSFSALGGDYLLSFLDSTDRPNGYVITTPTSGGLPQITFYPTPNAVYNMYVNGKKQITEMSSDSDTSIIPSAYHSIVLDRASFYGFSSLDDDRAKTFYEASEIGISRMKTNYRQDKGRHRVMRAVDEGYIDGPVYRLPSSYGPMS